MILKNMAWKKILNIKKMNKFNHLNNLNFFSDEIIDYFVNE